MMGEFILPEGLVVFSKYNCPACVTLKSRLSFAKMDYTEVNIEDVPEARSFLINKGFRSMPVVFSDGTHLPKL
jgi:glutaredoxin